MKRMCPHEYRAVIRGLSQLVGEAGSVLGEIDEPQVVVIRGKLSVESREELEAQLKRWRDPSVYEAPVSVNVHIDDSRHSEDVWT